MTKIQLMWMLLKELFLLSLAFIGQNLFITWIMWRSSDGSDATFILNVATLVGVVSLGIYMVFWGLSLILRLELAKQILAAFGQGKAAQ